MSAVAPRRARGGRPEQRLVQQLVAKLANGALDEPVLLRLAWRDVVPADAGRVGPAQDRVRDQLAVVVGSDLGEDDIIRFEDPYGRE
jgi:hypothetical protein